MIDQTSLKLAVRNLWAAEKAEALDDYHEVDAAEKANELVSLAEDFATLEIVTDCAPGVEYDALVDAVHAILLELR